MKMHYGLVAVLFSVFAVAGCSSSSLIALRVYGDLDVSLELAKPLTVGTYELGKCPKWRAAGSFTLAGNLADRYYFCTRSTRAGRLAILYQEPQQARICFWQESDICNEAACFHVIRPDSCHVLNKSAQQSVQLDRREDAAPAER